MQIIELGEQPIIAELWSLDHEAGATRSPGTHISTVIRAELEEQGTSRANSSFDDSDLQAFRAVGFLWERIMERVLSRIPREDGQLVQCREIDLDGIYMTPDFIMAHPDHIEVEEYKATMKSAKMQLYDREEWITQCAAYCKALGALVANIRVLHIRGYINPPVPKVKQYRIEFAQSDLDETWQRLTSFARSKGWIK
jgi:hypothetical protein